MSSKRMGKRVLFGKETAKDCTVNFKSSQFGNKMNLAKSLTVSGKVDCGACSQDTQPIVPLCGRTL